MYCLALRLPHKGKRKLVDMLEFCLYVRVLWFHVLLFSLIREDCYDLGSRGWLRSWFERIATILVREDCYDLCDTWFERIATIFDCDTPWRSVHCLPLNLQMSIVARKPIFRVCDQARNKPQRLEMSDIETRGIILSWQRTTNALIRLRGCAG